MTQAQATQAGVEVLVTRSPTARVSQFGVSTLVQRVATPRISQAGVEVLRSVAVFVPTNSRVTQAGVEVLRSRAIYIPPNSRVTQAGVEYLRSTALITTARTSQVGIEVLCVLPPKPRVTQAGVEVLRSRAIIVPPGRVHVTQAGMEVLAPRSYHARVNQAGVEVIARRQPAARVTASGVEVLRSRGYAAAASPLLSYVGTSGLRTILYEPVSMWAPFDMIETAEGDLVLANGIDPVLVWPRGKAAARKLGVPAPRSAIGAQVEKLHLFVGGDTTIIGGDLVRDDGVISRVTSYRVVSGTTFTPTTSAAAPAPTPTPLPPYIAYDNSGATLSASKVPALAANFAENTNTVWVAGRFGSIPGPGAPLLYDFDYKDPAGGPVVSFTPESLQTARNAALKAYEVAWKAAWSSGQTEPAEFGHLTQGAQYVPAETAGRKAALVAALASLQASATAATPGPTSGSVQVPRTDVVGFSDDVLAKTIHGRLYAAVRYLDEDGHPSDFSPLVELNLSLDQDSFNLLPDPSGGGSVVPQVSDSIRYYGVPTSSDPRVKRRQILRSLDGDANTFYVDIDTGDLTSGQFTSSRPDSDLIANSESVPIIDPDGHPVALSHGEPPAFRARLAAHLGRLFLAGSVADQMGSVTVAAGSSTVQGVGTSWIEAYVGRSFRVSGSPEVWTVAGVNVGDQSLRLDRPYDGPAAWGVPYSIDQADGERRNIYFSEPGDPWSWPATNAFSVAETGDRIVGLFVMNSFLYIVEEHHLHRATGQDDPNADLYVFPGPERGAISGRCIIREEGRAYLLDEEGVYGLTGDEQVEDLSAPIKDLFNGSNPEIAIDWSADRTLWFGIHDPLRGILRWFVALRGVSGESCALCYHLQSKAWWIESYAEAIWSGSEAVLGARRAIVGLDVRQVAAIDPAARQGALSQPWTASVVSAAPLSLTIETSGTIVPGFEVRIVEGRGREQTRRIVGGSGSTVGIDRPWMVLPDATSVALFGGTPWTWKTGWMRLVSSAENNQRDIEVIHEPLANPGAAAMEVSYNHSREPRTWWQSYSGDGVEVVAGDSEVRLDLSREDGVLVVQAKGHGDPNSTIDRFVQIALSGVAAEEVTIYQVTINGVEGEG